MVEVTLLRAFGEVRSFMHTGIAFPLIFIVKTVTQQMDREKR